MDGGAWQAAVHGVANSRTRLSDFTFTFIHLFIHLSLDKHLGCFHFLATVNNVEMNSRYFFEIMVSFWGVDTQKQDCCIIQYFYFEFFEKPLYCFLQQLCQFMFPSIVHKHLSSPDPHQHLLFIVNRCEVISHCDFYFNFPDGQ